MKNIQWNLFTPDTFRNFCNTLLWLEIGDEFVGYEAPGKDGGIDGYFSGIYDNKIGPWRFQYKFHATARKTAFQSLKRELKDELTKIKDEKQFVLLTNVALSPNERKEVETISQKYLSDIGLTEITFRLWDSPILSRFYIKYPLLKLWLEEDYTRSSIVPYKKKFVKQLSASEYSIDTLTNLFVSRENELKLLTQFLQDDEINLAIIKGEAGIGKTRLILEFFKNWVDGKSEWLPLCVNQYELDFEKIRFSLGNGKKYILLVDDAQNFTSHKLADLFSLGGKHNESTVKLIFTIRELATINAFQLINTFEREKALTITLNKLSKEDTRRIFEAHLKDEYLKNFIDQLVLISRGRPILIVGILNAVEKGENISQIKSQDSFANYVLNYFKGILERIVRETSVDLLKAKMFLGVICLLEPFSYDSPDIIQKLSQQENVPEDFVIYFFQELRAQGISAGNYEQSFKPDYYSDIFLKSVVNPYWLEKKLSQYPNFRSNILTNLASLDEVEIDKSDGNNPLDKYLSNYIEDMRHSGSAKEFKERLQVINFIAFQKPELAKKGVQLFISAIFNVGHSFNKDYIANKKIDLFHHDAIFSLIKAILNDMLYHVEYYDFVFDSALQIYGSTKDKTLFSIFSYQHTVYLYQSSIQIQMFFVKRAGELLHEKEEEKILFLIQGLHELLKLSFNSTKWDTLNNDEIKITTHYLPNISVIEQHRLSILSVLKTYYLNYKNEVIRLESLKNILDVPREIAFNKRNNVSYISDNEIEFVLQFLEEQIKDCTVSCEKVIRHAIYWYKYQRIDNKFHSRIDEIEKLLTPQSPTQRFVQVFSLLETEVEDIGGQAKKLIDDLFQKYNGIEIIQAFLDLFHAKGTAYFYYSQAIVDFTIGYTKKAKEAYLYLKSFDKNFIYEYGSHFLRAFRRQIEEENFYWNEVNEWLIEDTSSTANLLLHIYCIFFADKLNFNEKDRALIEKLCAKQCIETEYNLAFTLPTLFLFANDKSAPS